MNADLIVREAHGDAVELLRDILVRAFREYEGRLDPPSGALAPRHQGRLLGRCRGAWACTAPGRASWRLQRDGGGA